jgi:dihydrofolate reductase
MAGNQSSCSRLDLTKDKVKNMERSIIVAIADNYAIGKKNALLWHISEDLKYFKRITSSHPVIMGYMTFKSIGRPLPGRTNVVTTWYPFDAPQGVIVVSDLEAGFKAVEKRFEEEDTPISERKCFVIGGGETYRQALPTADTLYITHVHATVEDADTFFPRIDPMIWEVEQRSDTFKDPETGYSYEFTVYRRR